ncbi:hypothetical protein [Mycobacterium sp. E1747]|uniref:hypothetical protein n=1 Tax=Mycobacterium sp. E1747 TaxID=1834128 RepID=UPI001E33AFE9|nr:hypothetical protein [Mycobacterium sp. E1747]
MAVAGLMIAAWTASAGYAGADPGQTPAPSPSPAASQGPPPGPPPSSASPAPSPAASQGPPPGPPPSSASPAPSPAAAPGPGPKTTIDKDGIYNVGSDIAPGIYSSGGPVNNGTCYWKRTGNPDGNIIDNAMSKKPQVVQIDPTDKAFKTSGCQPWQLTPDAALPPTTPPAGVQGTLGILNGLLGGQGGQQPPHS